MQITRSHLSGCRFYARTLKLRCDSRQHQGQLYLLFYKKLEWSEIIRILKTQGGPYGKVELVDRTTLPNYASIETNIIREVPDIDQKVEPL